jgi:hypothetical protein
MALAIFLLAAEVVMRGAVGSCSSPPLLPEAGCDAADLEAAWDEWGEDCDTFNAMCE